MTAGTTSTSLTNDPRTRRGTATAIVGMQWGDEGKGKAVDLLTREHDAVVRFNGGANAGHSVVVGGQKYKLHLIPSGILSAGKACVIGNGVVLDPGTLLSEMDGLASRGIDLSGLVISSRAHVVMPYHKDEDARRETIMREVEGGSEIGTTKRGIGPCYAEKAQRGAAVRIGDLLRPEILRERVALACKLHAEVRPDAGKIIDEALAWGEKLRPRVRDTAYFLQDLLARGQTLLFEGANGTLLDVDHGTYPFVTSSNTGVAGIFPGTGLPPAVLGRVVGVVKAYSTRVGSGPMPTELKDQTAEIIRTRGNEFGTTTGRPRRVGWLDLVAVKYSAMINGATELAVMLADVLGAGSGLKRLKVCVGYRLDGVVSDRFPADAADLERVEPVYTELEGFDREIGECRSYDELPATARAYLGFIETYTGVPVRLVSVGPGREQTIAR